MFRFVSFMVYLSVQIGLAQTPEELQKATHLFNAVDETLEVENYSLESIENILRDGANPNILIAKENYLGTGLSSLHLAATVLDTDLMHLLLRYEADPNLESQPQNSNEFKITPIFMVARLTEHHPGAYEALDLLLKYANLRVKNPIDPEFEMDILTWLTYQGWPDLVQRALDSGANPNRKNPSLTRIAFELAPPPFASQSVDQNNGYYQEIKIFVKYGVDPLTNDSAHANLLHLAALYGDEPFARHLLYEGVNPMQLNRFGQYPHHVANMKGHSQLALFLFRTSLLCSEYIM